MENEQENKNEGNRELESVPNEFKNASFLLRQNNNKHLRKYVISTHFHFRFVSNQREKIQYGHKELRACGKRESSENKRNEFGLFWPK